MKTILYSTFCKYRILLNFMFTLLLTANSYAGEVLFSFDSEHTYVREGELVYAIPNALFEIKHGKAKLGSRVSLLKSELNFVLPSPGKSLEKAMVRKKENQFKDHNYGGRVYISAKPYYYLLRNKVEYTSNGLGLSPRDVEFTWVLPKEVISKSDHQRSLTSTIESSVKYNEASVQVAGTLIKSESLGIAAVKSGDSMFWFKEEAMDGLKVGAAERVKLDVKKDQILWVVTSQ